MGLLDVTKRLFGIRQPFLNDAHTLYLKKKYDADGCIFMMHRVDEHNPKKLFPNENMKVTPEYLENLILEYKTRGISFLSLDDISAYHIKENKTARPFVCFTLDDGYKDNFTKAYPIFKKHNVPFAVYIATDFPDYKALLWWYELEDLILSNSKYVLGTGEALVCGTYEEKCKAFLYIRELILKISNKNFMSEYCKLLNLKNSNVFDYVKQYSMSWDEIREMANDPICTIGGHSISHPAFNMLTDDELEREVQGGCERLEQCIGKKIEHFAYPFGSPNEIGEREHFFLSKMGFKSICTTDGGYITKNTDINRLPRKFLGELKS